MFALCSQHTDEVLSPRDKKHELGGAWWLAMVSHTVTTEAKNSKELFLF
jgi:hypothetical protein